MYNTNFLPLPYLLVDAALETVLLRPQYRYVCDFCRWFKINQQSITYRLLRIPTDTELKPTKMLLPICYKLII